jgi:hypothetical protein
MAEINTSDKKAYFEYLKSLYLIEIETNLAVRFYDGLLLKSKESKHLDNDKFIVESYLLIEKINQLEHGHNEFLKKSYEESCDLLTKVSRDYKGINLDRSFVPLRIFFNTSVILSVKSI